MSRIKLQKEIKKRDEDVLRFIEGYSTAEAPQSVDEIRGDFQFAGLTTAINSYVSKYSDVTILDIGCGNGTLLAKVIDSNIIADRSDIQYIGLDFKSNISAAFSVAVKLDALEIARFLTLETNNWTKHVTEKSIIVIRNVFHELRISNAAELLHNICTCLPKSSVVFIQDMTTLPTAERRNAGWIGLHLKDILEKGGLRVVFTPDVSKRGISVFLIEAVREKNCMLSKESFEKLLLESREKQIKILSDAYENMEESNENCIKICRLSHDIAAISLDVRNYKKKDYYKTDDAETFESIFSLALKSISENEIKSLIANYDYPHIKGFQNRGKLIDSIDEFLRSDKPIYVLRAGRYIGKKTLVWWALSQKLRHEKLPIYLFLNESSNISTILEELIIQAGVNHLFDADILISLKNISLDSLKNSDTIRSSLLILIKNSILILDGFENCIDPNNCIQNEDVSWFVDFWSDVTGSKVIIQTRTNIEGIAYSKSITENLSTFPKNKNDPYKYTRQLLDELIPISHRAENVGFHEYPKNLLAILDNHPYFIYITGTLIRNNDDIYCLTNQNYLSKLENQLYEVLVSEFILEKEEQIAIYSLSLLQISVPMEFIKDLCGETIALNLLNKGFLVQEMPGKFRLLGILNNIKITDYKKEDIEKLEHQSHKRIASLYYALYKRNSDPSFLRQTYHHELLFGDKKIPAYILPQLTDVANYWFSNKRYSECVWAYETIQKQRKLHSKEQLRFASCLIRTKQVSQGKKAYSDLISDFKDWKGAKSSYVDSLLFVGGHAQSALKVLSKIPERSRDYYWHRQKAKCYIQTNNRIGAYDEYEKAIMESNNYESWKTIRDLISYAHRVGDEDVVEEWLNYSWNDLKLHIDEVRIEIGAYYERMDNMVEAEKYLSEAYQNSPNNAYCILPLIKTLCKLDKMDNVNSIMQSSRNATPKEVINYTRVVVFKSQKRFDKCVSLLKDALAYADHNSKIHLWGQWADLFYAWSQELSGEDKNEIAQQGLKYIDEIMNEKNVPAMMACRELAIIVEDRKLLRFIEENIHTVNDSINLKHL